MKLSKLILLAAPLLSAVAVRGDLSDPVPLEAVDSVVDACFQQQYDANVEKLQGFYSVTDKEELQSWLQNYRRHVKETVEQSTALNAKLTEGEMQGICQDLFLDSRPAITKAMVEELNKEDSTWTAGLNFKFTDASVRDAKKLMGSVVGDAFIRLEPAPEEQAAVLATSGDENSYEDSAFPEAFDPRQNWPECAKVIGHIRDQAECGSCWAMSSTEAFNDRLCIASKGQYQTLLSTQHTTSCCDARQCSSFGCNGGQPGLAWRWFAKSGVVTGGDYGDISKGDTCWPYEIPPCAHHVAPTNGLKPCNGEQETPRCRASCSEGKYGEEFAQDLHYADKAYSFYSVSAIKKSLMTKGPLTAAFTVYEDFLAYKGGVYAHKKGNALGGHAIKILGWGKEKGVSYWLIANSWNETWGEKGLFKIKIGDSGINEMVVGGDVSFKNGRGGGGEPGAYEAKSSRGKYKSLLSATAEELMA